MRCPPSTKDSLLLSASSISLLTVFSVGISPSVPTIELIIRSISLYCDSVSDEFNPMISIYSEISNLSYDRVNHDLILIISK